LDGHECGSGKIRRREKKKKKRRVRTKRRNKAGGRRESDAWPLSSRLSPEESSDKLKEAVRQTAEGNELDPYPYSRGKRIRLQFLQQRETN
jgi:hypothetical protein